MAVIEFRVSGTPSDAGIYALARSVSGESVMQMRHRVANGLPLLTWDTDKFPLTMDRKEYYSLLLSAVERVASSDCDWKLLYRPTPADAAESVTLQQLGGLLESDILYDSQERD